MEPDDLSGPDWSIDYTTLEHTVIGHAGNSNTSAAPNTVINGLSAAGVWTTMPINNHTMINGAVNSGDLSVSDGAGGWIKVGEALRKIMDRLAILEPDMEKMERYPALKAAYDNYKIMEALLNEEVAGRK